MEEILLGCLGKKKLLGCSGKKKIRWNKRRAMTRVETTAVAYTAEGRNREPREAETGRQAGRQLPDRTTRVRKQGGSISERSRNPVPEF